VVLVTSITVAQLILVYLLALRGIVRPFDGALKVGLEETITTLIILIATGFILWAVVDIIEATVQKILISEVELENAHDLTLEAWAKALELRGREVPGHSSRVTALSVQLAEHLGLDQEAVKQVRWGALLHDIGKMGIPEKLLLKSGPLTKEEWEVISRHTILAREIIKDIPYFEGALEIVRHHHEQYDGHGYPNQIKAAEIPISALLFSIVDNWDMLRSNRPYSSAWTDEKTIAYLKKESGKKFHPGIVDAFLSLIEETGN
jgi:putative nucleotidyltransferase with HDIG domain